MKKDFFISAMAMLVLAACKAGREARRAAAKSE
jgi:hypothetical protein